MNPHTSGPSVAVEKFAEAKGLGNVRAVSASVKISNRLQNAIAAAKRRRPPHVVRRMFCPNWHVIVDLQFLCLIIDRLDGCGDSFKIDACMDTQPRCRGTERRHGVSLFG